MKTVEEVIEKIRVEAGLKRLEFGCEIIVDDEEYSPEPESALFLRVDDKDESDVWADVVIRRQDLTGVSRMVILEGMFIKEIIGLEPQLNDLIFTIKKVGGEEKDRKGILESATSASILAVLNRYEWTKSVRQNLTDNKELLELVISLIY